MYVLRCIKVLVKTHKRFCKRILFKEKGKKLVNFIGYSYFCKNVLAQLPLEHVEGLTHIWLRKTNKKEKCQGVYTVGSGARLITLYPFPKSNQLILGKERPIHKLLTWYKVHQ